MPTDDRLYSTTYNVSATSWRHIGFPTTGFPNLSIVSFKDIHAFKTDTWINLNNIAIGTGEKVAHSTERRQFASSDAELLRGDNVINHDGHVAQFIRESNDAVKARWMQGHRVNVVFKVLNQLYIARFVVPYFQRTVIGPCKVNV